jgi:hypothetical protein
VAETKAQADRDARAVTEAQAKVDQCRQQHPDH